jgi:hypothetical protein
MRLRPIPVLLALAVLLAAGPAMAAESAKSSDSTKSDGSDNQKAPEHKITQAQSYLTVEPIYATIVDDDRPIGMLMVGMGIDVPDAKLRDVVISALPVLRDAYVRNLMAFTAVSVRGDAQPDVTTITTRLQAITDRALGKKGAKVLLYQVALRVTN